MLAVLLGELLLSGHGADAPDRTNLAGTPVSCRNRGTDTQFRAACYRRGWAGILRRQIEPWGPSVPLRQSLTGADAPTPMYEPGGALKRQGCSLRGRCF